MQTVSVQYTIKYELSIAPYYVWLNDNSCFNLKTSRKIKQVLVGGCIGCCIDGRFRSLESLRKLLVKPKEEYCPF